MGVVRIAVAERDPGPYPAGRRCAFPDCITVLSRVNPGPCCHLHEITPFAAKLAGQRQAA